MDFERGLTLTSCRLCAHTGPFSLSCLTNVFFLSLRSFQSVRKIVNKRLRNTLPVNNDSSDLEPFGFRYQHNSELYFSWGWFEWITHSV